MADEPEDKPDRDFDKMFTDHTKRSTAKLKEAMAGMVTSEALTEALTPITEALTALAGSKTTTTPEPQTAKTPEANPEPDSPNVTSHDVLLKQMQAQIESLTAEGKALKDDISAKDTAAASAADTREVESVLSSFGVSNKLTTQAATLFEAQHPVIHDEKQGRVHEMQGEFGLEFNSTQDAAEVWLKENRHFLTPKSGSNAGKDGGSLEIGSRVVDMEKMALNPDEYMAKRTEIHSQLEGRS